MRRFQAAPNSAAFVHSEPLGRTESTHPTKTASASVLPPPNCRGVEDTTTQITLCKSFPSSLATSRPQRAQLQGPVAPLLRLDCSEPHLQVTTLSCSSQELAIGGVSHRDIEDLQPGSPKAR